MTSSNISNVATGYQPGTAPKGNVDSTKKTEDAQAVFATLLSQTNLSMNQKGDMSKLTDTKKAAVDTTAKSQTVSDGKPVYQPKDQNRVKQADAADKSVEKQAEELTEETGNAIEQVMEEEFSVSREELQSVLEELGMNLMDLLNPAKLAQVVSELTGVEDVSGLLMNENFVQAMQALGGITTDLAGELGISEKELQQLLAELSAGQEAAGVDGIQTEQPVSQPELLGTAEEQAGQMNRMTDGEVDTVAQESLQTGQTQESVTDQAVNEAPEEQLVQTPQETAGSETQTDSGATEEQTRNENVFEKRSTQTAEHTPVEAGMAQNPVMGQTAVTAEVPVTPVYTTQVSVSEVLQQIAEFVRVNVSQDTTSLEMQLNPENLGKLYLHISSNREGSITAQFTAQNEAVKEALETQLVELKQTLNQQGVKVDAIEVSVATHEFERNLEQSAEREKQQGQQEEQRQGRRSLKLDNLDELSGLMTEEEQLAAQIMRENGNSMDVIA